MAETVFSIFIKFKFRVCDIWHILWSNIKYHFPNIEHRTLNGSGVAFVHYIDLYLYSHSMHPNQIKI